MRSGPLQSKVSAIPSIQYNRFLEPIDAASAVPVLNVLAASPQTSDIRPSRNPSHSKVSATPYISWQRFGSGSRVCGAEHETRPCMGVCAVGGERDQVVSTELSSSSELVIAASSGHRCHGHSKTFRCTAFQRNIAMLSIQDLHLVFFEIIFRDFPWSRARMRLRPPTS